MPFGSPSLDSATVPAKAPHHHPNPNFSLNHSRWYAAMVEYVDIAKRFSPREDLEKRLTGRFYTPPPIAERMARQALAICPDPESTGDPFCGDGRLVATWLRLWSLAGGTRRLRRIVLWDCDHQSLSLARQRVSAELQSLGIGSVDVQTAGGDTFERALSASEKLDLVLTNPPWELLKPDTRDGVDDHAREYASELRAYGLRVARSIPCSLSAKKAMAGPCVNLARAGAIVSAGMAKCGGALIIVLPSSLFADQASAPFREQFFGMLNVKGLDWYPAEARLFQGVDQAVVTAAAVAGTPTRQFRVLRHDEQLRVIEDRLAPMGPDPSAPVALQVGGEHEAIARELELNHPAISDIEADSRYRLWLGREIDETRIATARAPMGHGVPFLKGRHVFPFRVEREEVWGIDPGLRRIPATVRQARLAWRDVSRPNQRRRMHVAVVPEGNVTGNSLGVAYFGAADGKEQLLALLAVMNSLAFELQVRAWLATAHVSQGVLRKCSIPAACLQSGRVSSRILELVRTRLQKPNEMPELEVEIARAYGISRERFASLLGAFPKLSPEEKEAHLRPELWQ